MQENEFIFDDCIEEPLITDDGLLNPVALSELESAILNCPPAYERLSDNVEWSQTRPIHRADIVGAFCKWAIRQSPYGMPHNLEGVARYLDACLKREVKWDILPDHPGMGMSHLSLCDINRLLHLILMDFSDFLAWNEPKKGKAEIMFVSSFDGCSDPDFDFIDLSALLRNVCVDIRDERRVNDTFDEKFEKENEGDENEDSR